MGVPDVIVVGGGVIGLSIALRLTQASLRVHLFDGSMPSEKASWAAAGMLAPQKESKGPGPFLDLCLKSRSMYRAFVDEVSSLSNMPVEYEASGLLEAAFSEADLIQLEAKVAWQKAVGLRADLLDPERARELEPRLSEKLLGAAHFPDDHQVDNRQLLQALERACEACGVVFQKHSVHRMVVEENCVKGVVARGVTYPARRVVLAAGAHSAEIDAGLISKSRIQPVRGQMVELRPEKAALCQIVASPQGYLVPRRDGRIIAGSTAEFVGFDREITVDGISRILRMAVDLCPPLASAAIAGSWAGLRPWAEGGLPLLGPSPLPGLFYATGHFRNGILLAPITAKVLTECLLERKTSVNLKPFEISTLS